MESDPNSLDSDEGVELSNGDSSENPFIESKDQLIHLEAEIVYILLSKDVPVSRARRFQWLLDNLNCIISIPVVDHAGIDSSNVDMTVISAVPTDGTINKYLIKPNTCVKFLAHDYRFVYCIDMSPSHSAVDTLKGDILFDQILSCFKASLQGLCRQFTIPGDTFVFQPSLYITVIVNTPFFMSPAQQVLVKGVKICFQNIQEVINSVESQFHFLEGRIAQVSTQVHETLDKFRIKTEDVIGASCYISDGRPNIPNIQMISPDANFVNMLRYSMLAISLLPENSISHILVITDGVVAMPDSNIMESLLLQLHYESVAVSFLKVGPSFLPHSSAGYVSYTDLLYFIAQSTLGTYMGNFVYVKPEPTLAMNIYHQIFLLWSFYSKRKRFFSSPLVYDNKWTASSSSFHNSRVPVLLSKRQTEENITASVALLLSRRMREGYTVDHVKYDGGLLEVNLSLEWKTFIYIHYHVICQWPLVKNVARIEVHISAPYEFLHDITCLMKKESKSSYRQAVIERFWLRLTQLSSGDTQLAHQLSSIQNSSVWYTLPESVRSGMPLFILNTCDSSKFILSPSDLTCPSFVKVWQPVCQIESNNWKKWFHTHKFMVALKYDHPLPRHLHLANSSGRYQVVQCRQAATALYSLLIEWSSFILIDNHTYIKFLYLDPEKPPMWFCIIQVIPKFPCAIIRIGFITATPGFILHRIKEQLKLELSTLTYLANPLKSKETIGCTLLENPLERILIRYERMPSNFTTVIFPDGTQPPQSLHNFPTSPLPSTMFTTLSRYLHHKRWIWSTSYSPMLKLEVNAVSRILSTLTRMRIKEGYNFAHSSSGIITMVCELCMEQSRKCMVQYVLFPPHRTWNEGDVTSGSEEDVDPDCEIDSELQMITEVWVEPQYGLVQATNPHLTYLNNKHYFELADMIKKTDLMCINSLLTIEHLSLVCQNKICLPSTNVAAFTESVLEIKQQKGSSQRGSRCSFMEPSSICDIEGRIQNIPFNFDPIGILPTCHQTELLFSTFIESNERLSSLSHFDFEKSNKLLLENLQEHLLCLHDHELIINEADSYILTQQIVHRHSHKAPHLCPIVPSYKGIAKSLSSEVHSPQWRCFIKGISVTHVILTFIPDQLQSLKALVGNEGAATPINDSSESTERASSRGSNFSDVPINANNSITLPMYVFDCSLTRLVDAYVGDKNNEFEKDDTYEDHRFKLGSIIDEDTIRLNDINDTGASPEPRSDESEVNEKSAAKFHTKALILAHSKCFVVSLFSALQYGAFVHSLDVQLAMDQCEETLHDIDISYYMQTICGHLNQQRGQDINIDLIKQPFLCNELKPLHHLIKDKFFEIMNIAFRPVPTNREFYYCHNFMADRISMKADSDDEISIPQSDGVEFKSDKEISSSSEIPTNSVQTENKAAAYYNACVSPLFIHLVCTIRYNNEVGHTSVKLLPTCLDELLRSIEITSHTISSSNLHITLDILYLTLPSEVQNVLNDYSAKGLRTTSFCSDGFPPSVDSIITENSFISDIPDPLLHLPEAQRASIINLRDKIKWLLKDEITTALLDGDLVTFDTLNYVTDHISSSVGCSSCVLDVIELHFVYGSTESYEKFETEFSNTEIPRYKLHKEDAFYYLAKKLDIFEETKIRENLNAELVPLRHSFQNLSVGLASSSDKSEMAEINGISDDHSYKVEVFSQQSDVSSVNESFVGTDGGYNEDISEDDEDFTWLMKLEERRPYLPNFWLIMQMNTKAVTIYFHCRFLELPTTHVGTYLQVQRAVREAIRDLCKKVNQFMLLRSLNDTRACDFLLEPDDNSNWHTDVNNTPALTRNTSFSRLKSMDETSDECDQYPVALTEVSLKFTAGYFSCPVVWQAQFALHPRLKSGPGKSGLSRGVLALKTVLDKFSVSNRNNMFVYKDVKSNVFYLRLCENFQICCIKGLPVRSVEYETAIVSRSPSIASLPQKSSTLTHSQHSIGSSTSRDSDIRPRVRSFGENESKDNPNEDVLILKVHGITEAGEDVRCGLVQVLQNRLDDAVLECLSAMLARNALCPLTPEDVHFLQKPFRSPEIVIKLSVQDYALKYLEPFVHYLHQNLLQFLNIPKYTDSRSHYHFKDYSETETNGNKFLDENIFIYNQSQNPSSGSKGIACIAVAVIQKNDNKCSFDGNFAGLFEKYTYQEIVHVKRIEESDSPNKTYLEFRLWKQGKDVFTDNLFQKLSSATSQALWDVIIEYYLLKSPLCEVDTQNTLKTIKTANRMVNHDLIKITNAPKEVECNVLINLNFKSYDENVDVFNKNLELPKIFVVSQHKKKYIPLNSTARRSIQFNDDKDKDIISNNRKQDIKLCPLELGQSGVLTEIYASFLQKWFEFGIQLSVPSVRKVIINLTNQHIVNIVIKELESIIMQLSHDSTNVFQFLPLDDFSNETILIPYGSFVGPPKCLIIGRNFEQWKASTMQDPHKYRDLIIPSGTKHFQKFVPYFMSDNQFIPRQKFLWAIVTSSNILVYTYNWSKDKIDKLCELLTSLGCWLSIRSGFLNSVVSQKLGIFYNQPIARSSLLASNNPFITYAGDIDCMLKFPKDRCRRAPTGGLSNQPVTILETYRDSHQCIKVGHHDPVIVFAFETQELKRSDKKHKEELKKLHYLWQSRTSTCTSLQINILKQNSRVIHFCFTPLLFLPGWRIQSASTRDHSLIQTSSSNSNLLAQKKKIMQNEEEWHNDLCYQLITEFKRYLQTLGFIPLKIENPTRKHGFPIKEVPSCNSVFFVQKAMLGGILIFTLNLNEPFVCTKLHVIECSRLHSTNSRAAINQFTLSFLDECDRIKTFMHLHSFTYDYHLRCIHNYISNKSFSGYNLCEGYHVVQFLDEFLKYYSKAPNFARNLVHEETVIIKDLKTEGKHLYDYLLSNVTQYGMEVFRMQDIYIGDVEYILIQISTAPQMSYKDSQDFQHTDDFDISLIVTYLSSLLEPHEYMLPLKYYLILSSRREIYPKDEVDRTLGKFRTVSSTFRSISAAGKDDSEYERSLSIVAECESEYETDLTHSHDSKTENDSNSSRIGSSSIEKGLNLRQTLTIAHVEIKQESVNYLGYYSSHEQLMQQLILDRAVITRKKIKDMVTQGMVDCRTHLLWNKFVSRQDINCLSYSEFIELKNLAQLHKLCEIHPNLSSLLDQSLSWYQGLSKLLVSRYVDQHRLYVSPDLNVQYYAFLHPRYDGAFMLLSMDLHTSRGDLYAAYRASYTYKDSDIAVADRKALLDGFINCVSFYVWTGLI